MNHPHKSLCVHLLVGMAFVLQQVGVKGNDNSTATPSTKLSNSSSVNKTETTGMMKTFATTALNSNTSLLSLNVTVSTSGSSVELSSLVTSSFPTQSTITSAVSAINPSFSAPIQNQVTPSSTLPPTATPTSGSLAATVSAISSGTKDTSSSLLLVITTPEPMLSVATPSFTSVEISNTFTSDQGSYSTTVNKSEWSTKSALKNTSLSFGNLTPTTPLVSPNSRFSSTLQLSVSTTPPPTVAPGASYGNNQGGSSTVDTSETTESIRQMTTRISSSPVSTLRPTLPSVNSPAVSNHVSKTATATQSGILGSTILTLSSSRLNTTSPSNLISPAVSSTWNTYSQSPLVNSSTTGISSISVMSTVPLQPTTDSKITTVLPTKRPFTANCWGGGCSSANGLGEFSYLVTSALILSCFYIILAH